MNDQYKNQAQVDEEITFKELVLKLQEYWRELMRKWWLIALICLPIVGYFIYSAYNAKPTFDAEIRFIVEGEENSGIGGLGGLLGSLGIRKGRGGTNPYKILEVGKSKRLIEEVLFAESDNQNYIANNIINSYTLDKDWGEHFPELLDFNFKHDSLPTFDEWERKAFLGVYTRTIGNKNNTIDPLLNIGLNDDTGIYSIKSSTTNENLSVDLVERTFDRLKFFFEEKVLEDKEKTRDVLKEKTDSIEYLIQKKTLAAARFEDQNRGLISKEQEYKKSRLVLEVQGLTSVYVESLKNFEFADFNLQNSKPLFLAIDTPITPINPEAPSIVKNLIIGGILGVFLSSLFIIGRYIIRSAMA